MIQETRASWWSREIKDTSAKHIKHNEIKSIRVAEKLKTSKKGLRTKAIYGRRELKAANVSKERLEEGLVCSKLAHVSQINVNSRFHQKNLKTLLFSQLTKVFFHASNNFP